MLVALITDIHGNREALTACLDHARRSGVGRYVFLGDYIGYGADPGWVVDTVMAHVGAGAIALRGNHDEAVFGRDEVMNHLARAAIRWTAEHLSSGQRDFLARLPLAVEEGDTLFVHANAWAPGDWGYVVSEVEAERSMRRTRCRVTICGHVHVPAVFHMAEREPARYFRPVAGCAIPLLPRRRWLAVIGAVGQPRDGDPSACYALLDTDENTLTFIRVPYDIDAAARKILHAGLPPALAVRLYEGR